MIKVDKIKDKDVEKAYEFCMEIFEELDWDKRFSYGLRNLKEFFNGPREVFLLAKKGKKIIGSAGLKELSKEEALMKRFYVAKDFRGKGVAPLIFEKIKDFAKEQNYKVIVLDTFQNNFRAKRFYQKLGFKPYNPKPDKKWKESQHPELFDFRKLKL